MRNSQLIGQHLSYWPVCPDPSHAVRYCPVLECAPESMNKSQRNDRVYTDRNIQSIEAGPPLFIWIKKIALIILFIPVVISHILCSVTFGLKVIPAVLYLIRISSKLLIFWWISNVWISLWCKTNTKLRCLCRIKWFFWARCRRLWRTYWNLSLKTQ